MNAPKAICVEYGCISQISKHLLDKHEKISKLAKEKQELYPFRRDVFTLSNIKRAISGIQKEKSGEYIAWKEKKKKPLRLVYLQNGASIKIEACIFISKTGSSSAFKEIWLKVFKKHLHSTSRRKRNV